MKKATLFRRPLNPILLIFLTGFPNCAMNWLKAYLLFLFTYKSVSYEIDLLHKSHKKRPLNPVCPNRLYKLEGSAGSKILVLDTACGGSASRLGTFYLFFSSQIIGSQSSTLFPSGSMIQANFPFSWNSGPLKISTPDLVNCLIISSRSSTR